MAQKKDKKFYKRLGMTVLGVLFLGVSVGFLNYSDFGMDPFQTFAHGIALHVPLDFGTTYLIINVIELAVIFFIDKRKIGLGTMINLFLLGYVVDFSSVYVAKLFDMMGGGLILRIVSMVIGIILLCFCAAVYFTADMGVSTHDAISLILSEKQDRIPFAWLRVANDILCIIIGFALGQSFGIGTIISGFFTGPLVSLFRKKIAEPFLNGAGGQGK
ncbi:MAG: hypothetical protein IKE53_03665 [Clostridiales bacterium]|nr:hypothetical protein [Clostridiales bacterium]